jgi:hypothetical protein
MRNAYNTHILKITFDSVEVLTRFDPLCPDINPRVNSLHKPPLQDQAIKGKLAFQNI